MDFLNILITCTDDVRTILSVVKWAVRLICIAIPIVLIVLVILDLAKVVTAGNIEDKMKKEVSQKVVTRVVYSIIIFLVPTLVNLFFSLLPDKVTNSGSGYEADWWTCYRYSDNESGWTQQSGSAQGGKCSITSCANGLSVKYNTDGSCFCG